MNTKFTHPLVIKGFFTLLLLVLIQLFAGHAFAQKGIIRGAVFDQSTGEPLYGVSILVKETSSGVITDFDGKFEIQADPGDYSLKVSYISYAPVEITGLTVKSGDVYVVNDLLLTEEASELETVTITAAAIRTTESALLSVKRNAANLIDGISASSFRQIGDGDAASAVKRVTGVSVEGGKYIYVRGLGDRYTKTVLNGVDIPGLDPDRNTIQMDIFPTNVIDNIIVSKSFTADLPADFTGGVVDIVTKDFPEGKNMRLSLSGGFNPSMHFNSNYLTYDGGKTDWLGFDDGTRAIPTEGYSSVPQYAQVIGQPNGAQGQQYQQILGGFNKTLGGYRTNSLMDMGISFSLGDQIARQKVTWGYNFAVTYKNDTEFYQNAENNLFAKPRSSKENELQALERQTGDYGVNNVLLGGLAGVALKTDHSKYKLNFIHLQNGESKAGQFNFVNTNLGANFEAKQYNLEYSQRALSSLLLGGSHFINGRDWEINWKIAPTRSTISDPDIRFTRFREPSNTISTEVGLPTRIWRNLEEYSLVGKADVTKAIRLFASEGKLKFGGNYVFKNRDFNLQSFQFATGNTLFTGDPNEILLDENLFSGSNRNGVRYNADFIPINPNAYESIATNMGGYGSVEASPAANLTAILGLRVEKFNQYYTGSNQNGTIVYDLVTMLDDFDFFPTLNLIYKVRENQNFRFSASRTIARPSFKELSYAEILDPISGTTFIGGLYPETTSGGSEVLWDGNLVSTRVNNFDVRWEVFQERGQMFSVSGFYKKFEKPIEMVQFLSDPGTYQPRNVGNGTVTGVEFEFRKSLSFIAPSLENFNWNTNVTLTKSEIQLSESEFRSRELSSREGQKIEHTRDMAGQAPYLVNTGLSYTDFAKGWEAGLFYNVQGSALQYVGFGNRTDTYSVPFNSLNLNVNKTFGEDERVQAGFGVSNILNAKKEFVYKSYHAADQIFSSVSPGTSVKMSVSFSF